MKIREPIKYHTGIKTVVVGVRGTKELFDRCNRVAKMKETTRNNLIVNLIENYCDKEEKK